MDPTKPYKYIGFGSTKPYRFIGFGAMNVTKTYKFEGFGPMVDRNPFNERRMPNGTH